MGRAHRSGVTLIELLVVISITGILSALLVGAVMRVREAAARVECGNNLRQLALAVHSYESVKHVLPRYASGRQGEYYGSWVIGLLPYMDQESIYSKIYERDLGEYAGQGLGIVFVRNSPIQMLYCRSDASASQNTFNISTTNYLANWYAFTCQKKGAYSDPRPFAQFTDGVSNVVLFGEGYSVCSGLYRPALDSVTYHNFGITPSGVPSDDPSLSPKNFVMFQTQPSLSACDGWRSQTPHTAMNVALADGSVRSVSPDISLQVWTWALKPDDGNTLPGDWGN